MTCPNHVQTHRDRDPSMTVMRQRSCCIDRDVSSIVPTIVMRHQSCVVRTVMRQRSYRIDRDASTIVSMVVMRHQPYAMHGADRRRMDPQCEERETMSPPRGLHMDQSWERTHAIR